MTRKRSTFNRRRFLQTGTQAAAFGLLLPRTRTHSEAAFQLEEATIVQLQSAQSSGAQTARALAEAYLARCKQGIVNGLDC